MADDLALLKREFEATRHRLILTQQALAIAEHALEDIATRHDWHSDGGDAAEAVPQQARDGLRAVHAVLKHIDRGVEKGS